MCTWYVCRSVRTYVGFVSQLDGIGCPASLCCDSAAAVCVACCWVLHRSTVHPSTVIYSTTKVYTIYTVRYGAVRSDHMK